MANIDDLITTYLMPSPHGLWTVDAGSLSGSPVTIVPVLTPRPFYVGGCGRCHCVGPPFAAMRKQRAAIRRTPDNNGGGTGCRLHVDFVPGSRGGIRTPDQGLMSPLLATCGRLRSTCFQGRSTNPRRPASIRAESHLRPQKGDRHKG